MNRFVIAAGLGVLAAAVWLLAGPSRLDPVAWTPSENPGLTGPFAPNDALAGAERLHPDELVGADFIAGGFQGTLHTALADGRIVEFDASSAPPRVQALAPGRPLGFVQTAPQGFVLANPPSGLTAAIKRQHFTLADEAEGIALSHVSDVALDTKGIVYFTDASAGRGSGEAYDALLEHRGDGRLLRYDELGNSLTVLARNLQFPSGLTLGPDEQYLLVAETGAYRVLRHWLAGPRRGTTEPFIEGLPGFPAHITWNGRDRFWLAIYAPRIAAWDRLADAPYWRSVLSRLPSLLQPRPAPRAWVLGLDVNGAVVANLQDGGHGAFAPVSSVREQDGWLYLGSQTARGVARVKRP